ncbi:MAG: NAD(P)-binding protein, partial [Leptolyngbyaceae cyanobacterium CRU_2_3]|nr:NAD(P)-binding protein [Leptolyngbyaceae cyanobacterium CRU_2_3]
MVLAHPRLVAVLIPTFQVCHLQRPIDFDIAIAGAGIVGLTLACALKDSGLKIALIEARPRDAGLSQHRAYAITLMSGQIFRGLGVWSQISPHIATFDQIRLADAECSAVVNLQPEDLGTDELGYVGEHSVLIKALLEKLTDADKITWLCPAELVQTGYQPEAVDLTLSVSGVSSDDS